LVSEFIANIPDRWTVLYLTTDGFITNAPLAEIGMDGPVAQHLSKARARIDGPSLLDQKAEIDQAIVWRTRGIATVNAKNKPKLAMGGMRAPEGAEDRNAWFAEAMLTREPGQTYMSKEPLSFPEAHRTNADHVFRVVEKRMNFEFDFKRRPVDPTEVEVHEHRHLSLATVPWRDVKEFNAVRAAFERWHQQGGVLKTMADWRRWEEFQAGAEAAKAGVHRRVKGGLIGQAKRIFYRAYIQRSWGLPGGRYKEAAAALTKAGYPTKEQNFKDALRADRIIPQHTISAAATGVRGFVGALVTLWPEFEWWRLVRNPWERYLEQAVLPATFAPEVASETPLRAAEMLESCKLGYELHTDVCNFATFPVTRSPEEIVENDALCAWFFGTGGGKSETGVERPDEEMVDMPANPVVGETRRPA
jgi:hypothetical protein